MGRSVLFAGVLFVLVFAAGTSQSDVAMEATSSLDAASGIPSGAPEPTIGSPVTNARGAETPQKDPFVLFSAEGGVTYDQLSGDEKAAVDRGRNTSGWQQQNDAFANAVRERSTQARAAVAQHELGFESLEQIGVVP